MRRACGGGGMRGEEVGKGGYADPGTDTSSYTTVLKPATKINDVVVVSVS